MFPLETPQGKKAISLKSGPKRKGAAVAKSSSFTKNFSWMLVLKKKKLPRSNEWLFYI